MEHNVTIDVPVEYYPWDSSFQDKDYPSFSTDTEAVLYWMKRSDFNSNCQLSLNPHDKKWYLLSILYDVSKADTEQKKTLFWKEGWDQQREAYGKACWDEYYRGVRDAELDTVYDRQGFGEKVIQRLSKSMPKWMFANKKLKENNS